MRIHENNGTGYGRSASACGYCRKIGHNQYACPQIKKDWAFWKDYRIPVDKSGSIDRTGWYGSCPDSWGKWYEHCRKTYNIIIAREEAAKKKGATTLQGKPKVKRSCGFCGDKDHNRRKCPKMEGFLKDCHTANIKWRTAAYKELVQDNGISVGAAIVVEHEPRRYWANNSDNKPKNINGIITSINWDTLTVYTALEKHHEDAWSPLKIKVLLSNGESITINKGLDKFSCLGEKGAIPSRYHYGDEYSIKSIVAPAKQLLGEEWINGYKGAFETLTKKRTYEQLQKGMASQWDVPDLVNHIEGWK